MEPEDLPFRVVRTNSHTEVLGRATNLLIGRGAFQAAVRLYQRADRVRPEPDHEAAAAGDRASVARAPVAADAAFYSTKNEAAAKVMGVRRVCIPNRSTKSPERKREQKKRWFRNGQKWRTGCEGRISVVKRRHGLNRCRYKGFVGMKRWVGLGVIADNIVNIGRTQPRCQVRPAPTITLCNTRRPPRWGFA
jgi:Transposase DDE domain